MSKKWLFIIGSLDLGGAEQFLLTLSCELERRGEAVRVVSLRPAGVLSDTFRDRGIAVEYMNVSTLLGVATMLPKLLRLMRTEKPQVLVGWMYYGCIAATLVKLVGASAKLLWSIHHSLDRWENENIRTRACVRLLSHLQGRASAIHFCSSRSAETHFSKGFDPNRATLIYNGFELDRPGQGRISDRSSGLKQVGHIARFHPMKDHGNFIAAVAQLSRTRTDFRAVMVGKDIQPANPHLQALLREHSPSVPVDLLGPTTDVFGILSQFDVLVVSSAWGESFPIVVGEAMTCGVPCVATDIGDVKTLIGETGLIVPARDAATLAGAIGMIIAEPEEARKRRREDCRSRIAEHFSIGAITGKFIDLVEAPAYGRVSAAPKAG